MGHKHGHQHVIGSGCYGVKPWGRNWDPRMKIITAVIVIFGVITLQRPGLILLVFLFTIFSAMGMGLSFSYLARKLLLLAPFLFFMSIPIIFGGGLPPPPERFTFAALLTLKALTSMTVMVTMLVSQPLEEFLEGLHHLKVPYIIITVLFLAYRYAFLFIQELKSTQRALASRLFSGGLSSGALRVYGELSGGLFVKSVDRSEHVYRAMASRCFHGKLPMGKPSKLKKADIVKTLLTFALMVSVIVVEKVVP